LFIPGGTTKTDVQGFLDPRDRPLPPDGDVDDVDSSDDEEDTHLSSEDKERAKQRRLNRRRRRHRFGDRPPKKFLPRCLWFLRHFFALPSVSKLRIEVSLIWC